MNVRFYSALAGIGARELVGRLDLIDGGGVAPWENDIYVRHHREQLAGAPLAVRGGVIDAGPSRVRLVHASRYENDVSATAA